MFAVKQWRSTQPRELKSLDPRGLKSGPQSRFNFEITLSSKFVADKNDGPLPRIRHVRSNPLRSGLNSTGPVPKIVLAVPCCKNLKNSRRRLESRRLEVKKSKTWPSYGFNMTWSDTLIKRDSSSLPNCSKIVFQAAVNQVQTEDGYFFHDLDTFSI